MRWARFPALFAVLLLAIASCDGDSRPFSEAVEVRALNLTSLDVLPPQNFGDPLFINVNQSLQMVITGLSADDETIALSAGDRSWSVEDSTVASISDNGILRGLSDGTTSVSVSIGGIVSSAFSVTVSDATLINVSEIVGPDSLRRCEPQSYFARGTFDDNSVRTLDNVVWDLSSFALGELFETNGLSTQVNAFTASDQLTLTASVLGAASFEQPLIVDDSLVSLQLAPIPIILDVDQQINVIATAFYATANPTVADALNATQNVRWEILSGIDNVSVSNARSSRGLLTGLEAESGNVLRAFCGDTDIQALVVVNESGTSDSTSLSFLVGNAQVMGTNITLDRLADGLSLPIRVATGTEYDSENDISEDILFEVITDTDFTQPFFIDGLRTATPTIRLSAKGTATLSATRVSSGGDPTLLTITVD